MQQVVDQSLTTTDNTEVFTTPNTVMFFSDSTEVFTLHFFQDTLQFRFCELMVLRRRLRTIDLTELLDSDTPDVKILHLVHCDRMLILGIKELLELREVINGTFVMLELNSIIHTKLVRAV